MLRRLTFSNVLVNCGFATLLVAAYHVVLRWLMTHGGLRLGAVSYKLAPLYAYWRPHVKTWLLVPLVVLAFCFAVLRRTRLAVSMTDSRACALFTLAFVAVAVSVAVLDGGPRSIIGPLERTELEYFGAVDRVQGVARFLREYPLLAETMPMHARVHPPGAVLFVWAASKNFDGGPWGAAIGIIACSSLVVPIVFVWASRLADPGVARRAAVLVTFAPSCVLFTATSMDGPFAVPLVATMWLFWESLQRRPWLFGALAGLAATGAALMTYSVAVAILFCGVSACLTWLADPSRRGTLISACAAALASFLGGHAVIWLLTGYEPLETFRVAVANHVQIMAGTRHESLGRSAQLTIANLVAFSIGAGLPCTAMWWPLGVRTLCGFGRSLVLRRDDPSWRQLPTCPSPDAKLETCPTWSPQVVRFVTSAIVTVVIAACVPVYTMEVERVWLFLVPLVAIPVAAWLTDCERGTGRIGGTLAVAGLVAAQTVLTEVLLTTYW